MDKSKEREAWILTLKRSTVEAEADLVQSLWVLHTEFKSSLGCIGRSQTETNK